MLKEPVRLFNQTYVKEYTDSYFKIITVSSVLNSAVEQDVDRSRKHLSLEKSERSLSRSKSTLLELAYCNNWDWFFTGTIDKQKMDRYNLNEFKKKFSQFIRDLRKKYKCDIAYLFVFEMHKDGAWHVHGFLRSLPISLLHRFAIGDKMGKYIAEKVRSGREVYSWPEYSKKFGFNDIEPIRDFDRSVSYILKYISKAINDNPFELEKNLFIHSHGLKKAKILAHGILPTDIEYDYIGDYVKIKTTTDSCFAHTIADNITERFEGEKYYEKR